MRRFFYAVALLVVFLDTTWGQVFKIPEEMLEHSLPLEMEKPPELSQLDIEQKKTLVFGIAPGMLEVYTKIKEVDPVSADQMIEDRAEYTLRYIDETVLLDEKIHAVEAANEEIETIIIRQNKLLGEGKKNIARMTTFSEFMHGARKWEFIWVVTYGCILIIVGIRGLNSYLILEFPNWEVSRSLKAARFSQLSLEPRWKESLPAIEERLGLAYGHILYAYRYVNEVRGLSTQARYVKSILKAVDTLRSALKEFGIRAVDPEHSAFSETRKVLERTYADLERRAEALNTAEANFERIVVEAVKLKTTPMQELAESLKTREAQLAVQEKAVADREAATKTASDNAKSELEIAQQLMADAEQHWKEAEKLNAKGESSMDAARNLLNACSGLKPQKGTT